MKPPQEAQLVEWSPNRVVFTYVAEEDMEVMLNTNYARGWQSEGATILRDRAPLTVRVPAGRGEVTVHYWPPGLWLGMAVSGATVLLAALHFSKRKNLGRSPRRVK